MAASAGWPASATEGATLPFTEFPLPAGSAPLGITAGPDGNLWFTEPAANKIGRITPAGAGTQFPIPTDSSGPGAITAGPDGKLWVTDVTTNQIGRITAPGGRAP